MKLMKCQDVLNILICFVVEMGQNMIVTLSRIPPKNIPAIDNNLIDLSIKNNLLSKMIFKWIYIKMVLKVNVMSDIF